MRLKPFLIRVVFILFLVLIGIITILLILGIDSKPLVVGEESLTSEDVERIKQQWEENDPRQLLPGQIKKLVITERDLNLFLHYASSRFFQDEQLKLRVELYPDSAYI